MKVIQHKECYLDLKKTIPRVVNLRMCADTSTTVKVPESIKTKEEFQAFIENYADKHKPSMWARWSDYTWQYENGEW